MNYILMNKNKEVLELLYDKETHTITKIVNLIHEEYAPLGIIEHDEGITRRALNRWWEHRSIPSTRSGWKEIADCMDIHTPIELLEGCFGLSLSDQYWIKEKNLDVNWDEINFFNNDFSKDMGRILMGEIAYTKGLNLCSPDNACDGNLNKKWMNINGIRYLIKGGNSFTNQEPFNEVIATTLYKRILDCEDYVTYVLVQEQDMFYSACCTMVSTEEEFVPADDMNQIVKYNSNDSLYHHFLKVCEVLQIPKARLQIDKMIICDYIIANYDRHFRNFGAIRNVNTLEWVKVAPIFDSGSSLWATQPTCNIGAVYRNKPFETIAEKQLELVEDLSWLDVSNLEGFEQEVYNILKINPFCDEKRIQAIIAQIKLRITNVVERKRQLEQSKD